MDYLRLKYGTTAFSDVLILPQFVFFFQAEDGIRYRNVTGVRRVLFRSRFSSAGFCLALSHACSTFSISTVIPSDGFAFFQTSGSVQSSSSSAPYMTG